MFFESPFLSGLLASVVAGAGATTLGALPIFAVRKLDPRIDNMLLSFAAGVMLAATFFSLLLPALDIGERQLGYRLAAVVGVIAALVIGAATIALVHRLLPHEHFMKGREGHAAARVARIWLFVLAITIHNFPEGLSIGIGAASGDERAGLGVMMGIGLQNIPEGLSVAVAVLSLGYGRSYAFWVAALTGVVEIFGGAFGAAAVALSGPILPWALAFAAGAMLFVVSDEVIPETHRSGMEDNATASLFAGFVVMMFLDAALT